MPVYGAGAYNVTVIEYCVKQNWYFNRKVSVKGINLMLVGNWPFIEKKKPALTFANLFVANVSNFIVFSVTIGRFFCLISVPSSFQF